MEQLWILVVDDDESVLHALALTLRGVSHWQMTFAVGGHSAIEQLRAKAFDVVITDLEMPSVNGRAVLCGARLFAPDAIRIVHTGSCVTLKELDADALIRKPTLPEELVRVVEETVAARDRKPSR